MEERGQLENELNRGERRERRDVSSLPTSIISLSKKSFLLAFRRHLQFFTPSSIPLSTFPSSKPLAQQRTNELERSSLPPLAILATRLACYPAFTKWVKDSGREVGVEFVKQILGG